MADLDPPDDQWPPLLIPVILCRDVMRKVVVSGKPNLIRKWLEHSPDVADQDVQLLLGELRFSDEE